VLSLNSAGMRTAWLLPFMNTRLLRTSIAKQGVYASVHTC